MNALVDTQKIRAICAENDIDYLGLFGSEARGKAAQGSDLDLLVRYAKNAKTKSLLDHLGVQVKLTDLFGKKVDLVEEQSLKPRVKPHVFKDLKLLYERS